MGTGDWGLGIGDWGLEIGIGIGIESKILTPTPLYPYTPTPLLGITYIL